MTGQQASTGKQISAAAKLYMQQKGDTVAGADGGTYKLNYEAVDGPPLHPNCRCATQPVLVDDYENLAAEAERRIAKL